MQKNIYVINQNVVNTPRVSIQRQKIPSHFFINLQEGQNRQHLFHSSLFVTNETCVNKEQNSLFFVIFTRSENQCKKIKSTCWTQSWKNNKQTKKNFTYTDQLEVTDPSNTPCFIQFYKLQSFSIYMIHLGIKQGHVFVKLARLWYNKPTMWCIAHTAVP